MNDLFGETIFTYTRADAIEDGVLHDLSDLAQEAGFTMPLACTAAVWHDLNAIPDEHGNQSVKGRAWDMLVMARFAVKTMKADSDRLTFRMILHTSEGRDQTYTIHCGPGDIGEPVLTILRPDED